MNKKAIDAKVRPLANPGLEKASLLGAARLYINKDSLLDLTGSLENDRSCIITKLNVNVEATTSSDPAPAPAHVRREAVLWALSDKNVSPNVVMMSRAFQDAAGLKIGDQLRIALADSPTPAEAEDVAVRDINETEQGSFDIKYKHHWEFSIGLSLERAEQVYPGMVLEGVSISKLRRTFKVISVNSKEDNLARFDLAKSTIRILQPGEQEVVANEVIEEERGELILKNAPGLTNPAKQINDFLETFSRPFWFPRECESCGFVVHGGHGTGRTFILQRIADTKWGKVHWIKPSDKLTTIREVFQQAIAQQPSMVFLDDLEELIPEDRSNREAVIDAIGDALDTLAEKAASDGALPSVVVIATCSDYVTDIPRKLQDPRRLFRNAVLPIPRAPERLEILRYHDPPLHPEEREPCLVSISQKTHAYNSRDLRNLITQARINFGVRMKDLGKKPSEVDERYMGREDMEHALRLTRPTAMHDINLQPPVVQWQDVGGQDAVKKALSRMIKYTKETDPNTPRVLRKPPKGLLLYGPPGCSKTLSAQAMATESSFNFFSVKGAELLNMYVGESERAVRNLFVRARAASPSIIFFDEIDSIGGQRSEGGGSGSGGAGGSAGRSTGSVNMLTALLTEMDGFEALSGVLVIAATNRPAAMDPALLRPGRFDKAIYVGLPDLDAREAIFRINLRGQPLASDVDIHALAVRSEGHSGAEIKHICQEAELVVQERYDDDETSTVKLEFSMEDLESSLSKEPRNTTSRMLEGYTRWMQQLNGV